MDNTYIADKFIELEGLERCEFNDECDYCKYPENGSYAKMYRPGDDNAECEFYICGKCVVENQKQNNGHFNQYKLPPIIL